jgi:hypothetical protein
MHARNDYPVQHKLVYRSALYKTRVALASVTEAVA